MSDKCEMCNIEERYLSNVCVSYGNKCDQSMINEVEKFTREETIKERDSFWKVKIEAMSKEILSSPYLIADNPSELWLMDYREKLEQKLKELTTSQDNKEKM